MKQLTANVFVETQWVSGTQASAGSNSSFVTTSEGIVMIDSPQVPANAIKWREIMAEKGKLLDLINTEFHADHTMGNFFFHVPVISHEETMKFLPDALPSPEDVRQKVKNNYPSNLDLVKDYQVVTPTITFNDRLNLHLGDLTFELIHLPGHTLGQTAVYIPQERVVFTGDNFSNGFQPALSYCYPMEWLDSLEKILGLDVEFIVPGHGEVGDKKAVREFLSFLKYCVDSVSNAISKNMSKTEAIESIQFEDLLTARHKGREQQRKNVSRLYEMLSR